MNDPIRYARLLMIDAADSPPDPGVPEVVQVGRFQLESLARLVLEQDETIRALNAERKELLGVMPFGYVVAAQNTATWGPVEIEDDESIRPDGMRFRIVTTRAIEQRRVQKITARPDYIATVYSREDAEFISMLYNHAHALVRALIDKDKRIATADEQTSELRAAVICAANLAEGIDRVHDKIRILREAANRTDVPFVMPEGV